MVLRDSTPAAQALRRTGSCDSALLKAVEIELQLPGLHKDNHGVVGAKGSTVKSPLDCGGSGSDGGGSRTSAESPVTVVQDVKQSGGINLLLGLSFLDRFLAFFVLLAMILGVIIGKFSNADAVLTKATFYDVSVPIVVGLLCMMWPILTKVQYERLPALFSTAHLYRQLALSLVLNWIIGPFIMLGLAWATLPDLPTYRTGIILVGIARCIAMVMIWSQLAHGDTDLCAIIVIVNSVLQIALFSPFSVLFINVIGGESEGEGGVRLEYGRTAVAVLIYLGIPLAAGVATRSIGLALLGKQRFTTKFLPYFSPLALLGLLYTIILIFAQQATRVLDHIGLVFRTCVPLVLYFCIMWAGTFFLVYRMSQGPTGATKWGYKAAVVQSFTAGSNNFELAIAVAIAVYGVGSDQALAATIGPLVEVPVLLALTWVAVWCEKRLDWGEGALGAAEGRGGG